MGAYIYFKLDDMNQSEEANSWLEEQQEQKLLSEIDRRLHFWSLEDMAWEAHRENGYVNFMDRGEGQLKTSGWSIENWEEKSHLIPPLFDKLHSRFLVKVLSVSCGLASHYFDVEQQRMIVHSPDRLTGRDKQKVAQMLFEEANLKGAIV